MSALTQQAFLQAVSEELTRILVFIAEEVKAEFQRQGHSLTGALEESIKEEILIIGQKVIGTLWINDYYKFLDQGVPANRIPFSGIHGGGGTSKYIQALAEYAKIRMGVTDNKEALSVAFAIAHTHKKEGMPTKGSFQFSENNERTGFFTTTIKENEHVIEEGFAKLFGTAVDAVVAIYNSRVSGNVTIIL